MHEKEENKQLLKDHNEALKDCYEAQLRAVQLNNELAERTVAWLKERGTLAMRGVLGKCLPSETGQPFYLSNGSCGLQ